MRCMRVRVLACQLCGNSLRGSCAESATAADTGTRLTGCCCYFWYSWYCWCWALLVGLLVGLLVFRTVT